MPTKQSVAKKLDEDRRCLMYKGFLRSLVLVLGMGLIFAFGVLSCFAEEFVTITTYYPAPYGVYNEMRAKRMAVGDNYYSGSAYPWDTGGGCAGNEICNADLVVQGNVGIGVVNPSTGGEQNLKLDVEGAVGAKYYCDEKGNNCVSAPFAEIITFSANKNGVQLIGTEIWTKITFTIEEFDIGNYYDALNSRYIPPAGIYYIGAAYFQDNGPRDMLIGIYKNGVRIKGYYGNSNSGGGGSTHIETVVNVNGTDYIEIYAFFGGDTTINGDSATLYLGDTPKTYFYGFKIR